MELLLFGFKQDTNKNIIILNENDLLSYCICVASSIGIVCTFIFIADNKDNNNYKYDISLLTNAAVSLGIAFQLTNISRDIITDLIQQNKIYIPQQWMIENTNIYNIELYRNTVIRDYSVKLIKMAEIYYIDAWNGIKFLPTNVQFAIYSALKIYRQIGINILNLFIFLKLKIIFKN